LAIRPGSTITRRILNTTDHHVEECTDDFLREKQQFSNSNWSTQVLSLEQPTAIELEHKYIYDACFGDIGFFQIQCYYTYGYKVYRTGPWNGLHYFGVPHETARTRKLLSGTYDRSATTQVTQHAATRWQVPSSWSKQVSVPAAALVGLICAVAGLVLCCIRNKRPRESTANIELEYDDEQIMAEPEFRRGLGAKEFVHSELAAATDNFADEKKIGRGGFGPVYIGYFTDQDCHVAIKVLSQELSVQGLKEFQAEVSILSQLRHRNIVKLVGWCGRRGGLALVYELVPGGSLDTHLYNPYTHLTWPERYINHVVNSPTQFHSPNFFLKKCRRS
jgi:hypothetical protein